ncbi:MAG: ABC transporter permease [Christensenellaceae bacterium]
MWAAWLAVHALVKNDYLFPSFGDSMREAGRLLMDKDFWHAFSGTFLRTLAAFFLSFTGASVLAVVAYLVPPVGRFLAPLVSVLRSLPTMAVILIILVWTTPKTAPVVVAFLALFPLLYAGISAALASVDPKLVEMSRVYRVPVRKRIFGLYLPSAAPYALREASAALSFSLKLTVSAEVLANTIKASAACCRRQSCTWKCPLCSRSPFSCWRRAFCWRGWVRLRRGWREGGGNETGKYL